MVGATGKTGRQVVRSVSSIGGVEVRAASRRSSIRFDWDDSATWAPAVDGVDAMYVVDSQQGDAPESMAKFAHLARGEGVSHAVLLSSRDVVVSDRPKDADVVRALQDSGLTWTVLRPTWFMQNFAEWDLFRDRIIQGRVVGTSGDGLEPFIDTRDIADVAAAALLNPGRHAGHDYQLSGPDLLTFADAVRAIGDAARIDVRFEQVTDAEFRTHMTIDHGVDDDFAAELSTLFGWIRQGRNAHVSGGVQEVLGRPPRTFSDFATESAAQGVWRG